MGTPLVSVGIPVYNVAPLLRRCLTSVLEQTASTLEVLCVDDGSDDQSASILRDVARRDPRVQIITHRHNAGLGPARTTATNRARGEYLFFLDSDDRIPPDAIRSLLSLAREHDADIVKGANLYEYEDGHTQERPSFVVGNAPHEVLPGLEVFERILGVQSAPYIPISMCATLYRRSLFTRHRIIHPATYQEDLGTTPFLMAMAERVVLTSSPSLFYLQRAGSEMGRPFDRRRMVSYARLYVHMRDTLHRLGLSDRYRPAFACKFVRAMASHMRMQPPTEAAMTLYSDLVREVLRHGATQLHWSLHPEMLFATLDYVRSIFEENGLGSRFGPFVRRALPAPLAAEFASRREGE